MIEDINNKRIAKNTFFLYVRMFFILAVNLYTSRVVLDILGVDDYGIYNVVGGVVTLFTFISMAMGNATARFITYAIGKDNYEYQIKVFNTSFLVHIVVAFFVIILAETIGLWFLIHKMVIPDERMMAAHWVYQLSILAAVTSILYIPFNATIIAHEKMGTFAYISVLDVSLKLLIVYLLIIFSCDKLILYAILFLFVNLIDISIYFIYCKRNFPETKFKIVKDVVLIKEIGGFAGWSMIGNLASVGYTQGLNVLLNIFYGPSVNAARGISVQVQNATTMFVRNFQTAVNPQITKSYAQDNLQRIHTLIFSSTRMSFYLLFCIILPITIEADNILSVWLVSVPQHTVSFLRLILLITLINAFEGPVNTAMNATGQIKLYQIVSCSMLLMVIPLSYLFLKMGFIPEIVFVVQFFVMLIAFVSELIILAPKIKLNLFQYMNNTLPHIIIVTLVSSLISVSFYLLYPPSKWSFIFVVPFSIASVVICSYLWGISYSEKQVLLNYISKKCRLYYKKDKS